MAFADRGEEAAFDDQVLAIKALLDKGLIRHWALSNEVRQTSRYTDRYTPLGPLERGASRQLGSKPPDARGCAFRQEAARSW